MRKFTVFTVILTILVVVIATETFVNKYLPSLKGSVLQADQQDADKYNLPSELELKNTAKSTSEISNPGINNSTTSPQVSSPQPTADNFEFLGVNSTDGQTQLQPTTPGQTVQNPSQLNPSQPQTLPGTFNTSSDTTSATTSSTVAGTIPGTTSALPVPETALNLPSDSSFDIEDFSNSQTLSTSYLRDDQIVNSGFTGSRLETEIYDGFLYKTINISDLKGINVEKYNIGDGTNTYAKVYIITVSDPLTFNDIYNVIKSRAAEGIDTEVNETNDYGSGSFYMNDVRRSGVAFLTVKIGSRIYGFTYPKTYHPQIKNLISLLMLDNR